MTMISEYVSVIQKAQRERDDALKALSWFIGDNPAMEDAIWEDQPADALMTIRMKYSTYKQAREILARMRRPVGQLYKTGGPRDASL